MSDLESELSSKEEELADSFCWEEVPEDVSDLDNVEDMSVTDAGGGLRCLDAVLGNRGAEVVVICRPTPPPPIPADTFVSLMQRDKKVLNDQLRLVLLKPLGRAVISADVPMDLLRATLASAA